MNAASNLVVLVVEDDGFQRRTVARMCRALGAADVREAGNGREGLASLHGAAPVDLVVCDLDMPEMDGMEFLRHLGHANNPVSVVISSAQDRSLAASVEKMAIAYGVRLLGLMEKPVTLAGLEDMISRRGGAPQLDGLEAPDVDYGLDEILEGVRLRQFVPHYQPKACLRSGVVVGMEALARWNHPAHGLVPPSTFIGLLEVCGSIDELTLVMLDTACRTCMDLHRRGFRLKLSVNLSLVSLIDTSMADRITKTVQACGLKSEFVIFEITETAAMTQIAPALENLARLRMRGFGLSVDDFGTGFASLEQLMRVPFTELKIDRKFVTGCAENFASRIIVESSIEMARRLGISSVAEGVETAAEWAVVRDAQCDAAQGYWIAEPLSEARFITFCTDAALAVPSALT